MSDACKKGKDVYVGKLVQDGANFLPGQNNAKAPRLFGTHNILELGEILLQHVAIQKQQGLQTKQGTLRLPEACPPSPAPERTPRPSFRPCSLRHLARRKIGPLAKDRNGNLGRDTAAN